MNQLTQSHIRKNVNIAMLCAAASVIGILENSLPSLSAIPGGKIGAANAVIALALYVYGIKYAFLISILRSLVTSFVFMGANALPYSLAGAVLSMAAMAFLYGKRGISPIGVCISGALFGNAAKVFVSCMMLKSFVPIKYFAYLIPVSLVCGYAVGLFVIYLLKYKNIILKEDGK